MFLHCAKARRSVAAASRSPCKIATLLVVLASEDVYWDSIEASDAACLEYLRKGIHLLRAETIALYWLSSHHEGPSA